MMGTFVEIALTVAVSERRLNSWITAGFAAIEKVEALMSAYRPDSDVSRINRAASGAWIRIHPLTARVLRNSNQLFKASGGAFDIRCQAAPRAGQAPVDLRGNLARKTGPGLIDLGGIAKGFAVDRAVQAGVAPSKSLCL